MCSLWNLPLCPPHPPCPQRVQCAHVVPVGGVVRVESEQPAQASITASHQAQLTLRTGTLKLFRQGNEHGAGKPARSGETSTEQGNQHRAGMNEHSCGISSPFLLQGDFYCSC